MKKLWTLSLLTLLTLASLALLPPGQQQIAKAAPTTGNGDDEWPEDEWPELELLPPNREQNPQEQKITVGPPLAPPRDNRVKALLPQGSVLHRKRDGKQLIIPRDTYLNVRKATIEVEQRDYDFVDGQDPLIHILNKQDQALYTITPDQIIFIDQVADLFEQPTHYEEYIPRERAKIDSFETFHELSVALYQSTAKFLENVATDKDARDNISGIELVYQGHLDFDAPFLLGGQLHYSIGSTGPPDNRFRMQQWTLGPVVSVPFALLNEKKVFLQIGTSFSILFNIQGPENGQDFPFRSQSLKVGLQAYHLGPIVNIADFMYGVHFSREFATPRGDRFPSEMATQTTSEQKLSFLIGITW